MRRRALPVLRIVAPACAAIALQVANPRGVSACDFCMPIVGANPLAWHDYVSLYSHDLYMGQYRSGWRAAAAPPDDERDNHLTNELTVSRALGERITLAVTVLFPYQHMSVGGPDARETSSFGLGDTYVMPSYEAYSSFSTHVMVGPVLKAPTGQTNVVDSTGSTADPDFQLGSGSWDFGGQLMVQTTLLGGQLAEYFMAKYDTNGRFLAAGSMGAPLTHSYNYEGMQDVIYSHRLLGSQAGSALLLGELGLDVGFLGHEIYGGVANPDAGGAIYLLAAPGLEVILPGQRLAIEGVAQIPLVQYWAGTQLGYSFEAFLGIRYLYD